MSEDKQIIATAANSTIMVHHYCSEEHLFQTVTMVDEHERQRIFQALVENKSWYCEGFKTGIGLPICKSES